MAKVKLRTAMVLPAAAKRTHSVPRESFVRLVQAEVGSQVSLFVHRYRTFVPVAQIFRESEQSMRREAVATEADVFTIRDTLIGRLGGVTLLHLPPASASGVGARDPSDFAATLESNEHIAFEVYAAPVQESDDYVRAIRADSKTRFRKG
jgi:hypothetical protein